MDIEILTRFFMWCTIVNVALFALAFLFLVFASDFVYRMHGKWFPMPRETFNVVLYCYLGVYKLLILVFNLVPWVALAIIG
ncbi:MAG: hypothetical protein R6V12_16555 [Candidatus Hydrogenedentota bacterium]